MKCAVYVEGLGEMLLVADLLQKYSDYNAEKVGFKCIQLVSDNMFPLNYPLQGDVSSDCYYQIINVNSESSVISKLKSDLKSLNRQGFSFIIALRDVFGKDYEQLQPEQIIDRALIDQMHEAQSSQLTQVYKPAKLHFAIMEFEAWMLALIENYINKKDKTIDDIKNDLNIDLSQDFEQTAYHPAKLVKNIYSYLGENYGKHESNYMSFLDTLTKDDYELLRTSGRCQSFVPFLQSLFEGQPH